jgi:serine/threonine-protein kinase
MNACPSPEQLSDFLAEALPPAEGAALEAHVEGCPDCQQALERLTPGAPPADVLRRLENRPPTLPWTLSLAGRPPALEAETPSPNVPGYEVLQELGRGGMGVVYLARQVALDRTVALKMILHASPEARARFRVEAQAVARLRHPHIVQVHDFDEADGRPYFCLEYVEGGSLEARTRHAPQPPRQAALLAEKVAAAVQHAHDKGVIHRDLKPGNVLLVEGPETPLEHCTPKVTDFGLAKLAAASPRPDQVRTEAGAVLGTPSYMAPEQARGREVGPAADVWAVGALLYDLLIGRPPFYGETALDTLQQVLTQEPVAPRRLQPKVPRDLETICLKCLEKDPAHRYPSAQKLADDLANFREGRPIWARRAGPLERALRWVKREPRTAALVALALASVLLLAGAALWRARVRAEREAERAEQLAERVEAAEEQLGEAEELFRRARAAPPGDRAAWEAALSAARRAEALANQLPGAEELQQQAAELREEVEREDRGRRTADRLANLRLQRADPGPQDLDAADRAYATAFDDYEIPVDRLGPEEAAGRVKASPVAAELVAALDDWALVRRSGGRPGAVWRRPAEVARRADPDPRRNRVRDALGKQDLPALRGRAAAWDLDGLPAATLLLLGNRLLFLEDHAEAVRVLRRAWQAHRDDFWVTHTLASAHLPQLAEADEAVRFFSAAVALRPGAARAHSNLSAALNQKARLLAATSRSPGPARDALAQAEAEARQAIRLAPDYAQAHNNLGLALRGQGRLAEAVEAYQAALRLAPRYALAHNNLGVALSQLGRRGEASCCYRRAVALDPGYAQAHDNLGLALAAQGRLPEAALAHRTAVRLDPASAAAHHHLGLALSQLGRVKEAVVAHRNAARLRPNSARFHYNLALVLERAGRVAEAAEADARALRADGDRLSQGEAAVHKHLGRCLRALGRTDEAVESYRAAARLRLRALGRGDGAGRRADAAVALYNLGLVLRAAGRAEEAADAYRRALCLRPDYAWAHCDLGHVLRRQGRLAEALACLERGHALGSAAPDWPAPSDVWAGEARLLVALEACLPALLARGRGPGAAAGRTRLAELAAFLPEPLGRRLNLDSPPVRVLFARLCAAHRLHAEAARLYREAFDDRPALASTPWADNRLRAARSAALAGCGLGADAGRLDEAARAALRAQARAWLRADLDAWAARLSGSSVATRRALLLALRERRHDPDLACVRHPTALAALPEAERRAWEALWAEVAALAERALA